MELHIEFVKLGRNYIAGVTLAGNNVRGARADNKYDAVRNLFYKLSSVADDETAIALELAVEGKTFLEAIQEGSAAELESGD
jgi:hypothetical protein